VQKRVACLKEVVRVQGAELGRSIDGCEYSQKFYKPPYILIGPGELMMEIPNLSEEEKMNAKRIAIATAIGILCGLFCAHWTSTLENPNFVVTTGLLASVVYNLTL